jgi:hypothetical protein
LCSNLRWSYSGFTARHIREEHQARHSGRAIRRGKGRKTMGLWRAIPIAVLAVAAASFLFPQARAQAQAPPEKETAMISSLEGVRIDQPVTRVDLAVPRPRLESALRHLGTPGSVTLVLRDITAESSPGVLFNVYLVKTSEPGRRLRVGTISWFGAFGGHGNIPRGPARKTLELDVTDKLRALGGDVAASGLSVVIEATNGRVPADPAQAETERLAASRSFRPAAKMRIGAIELRQARVAATPDPPKE